MAYLETRGLISVEPPRISLPTTDEDEDEVPHRGLIAPHGGVLIDRTLTGDAREAAIDRARTLRPIALSEVNLADLEMIADGGFSPLTGYMTRADYESVVHHMRLVNGLPWSVPVTLAIDDAKFARKKKRKTDRLVGAELGGLTPTARLVPPLSRRTHFSFCIVCVRG